MLKSAGLLNWPDFGACLLSVYVQIQLPPPDRFLQWKGPGCVHDFGVLACHGGQ